PAPVPTAKATPTAPAAAPKSAATAELSPAVRRMVEEENVDPNGVAGTGKGGRLTKGDVIAHMENRGPAAPGLMPGAPVPPTETRAPRPAGERTTRRKLSPLRKKIAAHLVNAQHTAAILTTFNECDMSALMAMRSRVQDAFVKKHGIKLGLMSFFVKAV